MLRPTEIEGLEVLDQFTGERFDAVGSLADQLATELVPHKATELLPDWERLLGLTPDGEATTQERRDQVRAKFMAAAGISRSYFVVLAGALGYTATIEALKPSVCGVFRCGEELCAPTAVYIWRVTVNAAGSDEYMEALFKELKPGHVDMEFVYTG